MIESGRGRMFTKATSQSLSVEGRLRVSLPDLLVAMTAGGVLLGFAIRTTVGADAPLWLDETFTGAVAAQPSLWSVVHQILQDVNAPIYCLLAHAGSLLFTLSNQSLRFPALVFGSIAPLWIYDTNVHGTAARTFPPRITELASAWQCRDFGSPPIGILACTRKDAT
jgi:hypothetical protein